MAKTIIFILLIFLGIFVAGDKVLAALEIAWPNSPLGTPLTETSELVDLIKYIYEWLVSLAGLMAFVNLVIAGFQYLTSAGNAGKMREAMDRIKSATIGLILLLASVLILNTINPQLTNLRMPELPPLTGTGTAIDFTSTWGGVDPCLRADLYRGRNLQDPVPPPLSPLTPTSPVRRVFSEGLNSAEIKGSCMLTLYRLRDYETNADNPPVYIAGPSKVDDIPGTYGGTALFRSARLVGASGGAIASCESPLSACLYEDKDFNAANPGAAKLEIAGPQMRVPVPAGFNDRASSLQVNSGYALVLHQDAEDPRNEIACLLVKGPAAIFNLEDFLIRRVGNDQTSAVTLLKIASDQTVPEGAIVLCGNASCAPGGPGGWQRNITEDVLEFYPGEDSGATSAIRLQPSYAAVMFRDKNYEATFARGCAVVTATIENLYNIGFNDILSSIQVLKTE